MKTLQQITWLIWSNEHSAWWAPNHHGYVNAVENAGRYKYREAIKICSGACYGNDWTKNESRKSGEFLLPNEVMVPSPEMLEVAS